MRTKKNRTYEVRLYLGSINEETKESFSERELSDKIGEVQESFSHIIPVRVSRTFFVSGTAYKEWGWEIAAIKYPKLQTTKKNINQFMEKLAVALLYEFRQHRISIVMPHITVMFEETNHED